MAKAAKGTTVQQTSLEEARMTEQVPTPATDQAAAPGDVERNGTSIEPDEGAMVVPLTALARMATPDEIQRAVSRMLARIDATKRLKLAILSLTNPGDWCNHKTEGDPVGVPYLREQGAEKVVHAFEIEIEHDGGECVRYGNQPYEDYEWVYNGRARALQFSDVWYPIVGSRWSEDGFFTRGGKVRPDPGDVRKSALTNFYNRAIKTVCGLRGLTWDEIETVPHLKGARAGAIEIEFESGGRSSRRQEPAGQRSAIAAGPHIKVKLAYGDKTNQARVKTMKPWNWNNKGKYWEIGYTKENLNRVLDMKAESGDAVAFECVNVPADDLP